MTNLDFLKRNKPSKAESTGDNNPENLIMGNLTDQQLAKIAKANAPKVLGAIKPIGGSKRPLDAKLSRHLDIKY